MNITIENGVKEYMAKNKSTFLIVDMQKNVTNSGCGAGATKNFFVPEVRLGFNEEKIVTSHSPVVANDIKIFLSKKIDMSQNIEVTIYIDKQLFMKKLEIKGIDTIVDNR